VRDQRGFTLIEMLVGMAAGIVVISALFTIVDVTLKQTTRTFSRVDATQRARVAIETIETQMHSACAGNNIIPIAAGSNANQLFYWSQYGKAVTLTPVQHRLTFNSSAGTLTDQTFAMVQGSPYWTVDAASPLTTKTVLTNVSRSGSTPVFQYFSHSQDGRTPITSQLTTNTAVHTVEVQITFVVGPGGGSNEDTSVALNTVSNSVVLRLTPFPNPGTSNQDFLPCG
jgi:prepilin-type N-terminal cleavage/methylation domain-containing protein